MTTPPPFDDPPPDDFWPISLHEAGHLVVADALDLPIVGVVLHPTPGPDGVRGRLLFSSPIATPIALESQNLDPRALEHHRRAVLMLLGGGAAAQEWFGAASDPLIGLDEDMARRLVGRPLEDGIRRAAEFFADSAAARRAVERSATELAKKKKLSYADFTRIAHG